MLLPQLQRSFVVKKIQLEKGIIIPLHFFLVVKKG